MCCEYLENLIYGLDNVVGCGVLEVLVYLLCCKFGVDIVCIVCGFGYMLLWEL